MNEVDYMLQALDDKEIMRNVGDRAEGAKMAFTYPRNHVENYDEFRQVVGEFYRLYFSRARGQDLSARDAEDEAIDLLDRAYGRFGKDSQDAYMNCLHRQDGGLNGVIDEMVKALRTRDIESYIKRVFTTFVDPKAYQDKVEIMRQFFARVQDLPDEIDRNNPDRYANRYDELVRAYAESKRAYLPQFRKL